MTSREGFSRAKPSEQTMVSDLNDTRRRFLTSFSSIGLGAASPRVETPTHYILMGIDLDLNRAMCLAVQQVVEFLMTEKHMASAAALALASVGCDFHVAEAVDLTQVIVGKIPKSVFRSAAGK